MCNWIVIENTSFFCTNLSDFWSKKINKDRDSLEQIFIGTMDPSNRTLMELEIYLEYILEGGGGLDEFLFVRKTLCDYDKVK